MTDQNIAASSTAAPDRFDFSTNLWEPLARLRGEFDRLFDDVARVSGTPIARRMFGMAVPPIAMTQGDKGYRLTAELPGMEPGEVEIAVTDGTIRIAGEKREVRDEKEQDCFVPERRYGAFERSVELPSDVDPALIDASFRNGVLTIRMARGVGTAPSVRKIEIGAD